MTDYSPNLAALYAGILLTSISLTASAQEVVTDDELAPVTVEAPAKKPAPKAAQGVVEGMIAATNAAVTVEASPAQDAQPETAIPAHHDTIRLTLPAPLKSALTEAYGENPALQAARREFEGQVEAVPQALSGALPSAQISYQKGRRRTRNETPWNYGDAVTQQLTVTQPLFRGGSTYANTKTARRNVDAALFRLLEAEQTVLLEAVQAYTQVTTTKALLGLAEKNRDVLQQQLKASNQRFEVGEDTRTDTSQSKARLSLAQSEVIRRRSNVAAAEAIYREVIGKEPGDSVIAIHEIPPLPENFAQFKAKVLQHNPNLRAANYLKEAADYVVDSNIGTLLPSVDLQASMNRQEGAGLFGETNFDQDQIIVAASMPLYQGGANYSRIRQAKSQYQQRRFEMLDTQNAVERIAVQVWEEWKAAEAVILSNQDAVEAATIALDGVKQEQQYGARTTLDVLDAERELFDTQVQLAIAERDRTVSAYRILSTMGSLTANALQLEGEIYDAEDYYSSHEYRIIGF